jgi:MoxR-like ATPase
MASMIGERKPDRAPAVVRGNMESGAEIELLAAQLRENLAPVLVGKPEIVDLALVALLCEGHILIEDVPGVGKTTLARGLAQSLGGTFRRLQCTPDLLPSDVTGVSIFDQKTSDFVFRPGPVFANVVLADEINRATPRAQSSLLECMEEHQVTGDGETRPLPRPFLIIATQNPIELEGTFPLPEAQLDRFLLRLRLGYPSEADEERILIQHAGEAPSMALPAIAPLSDWLALHERCRAVRVDESVRRYAVQITRATRESRSIVLGASPRATLGLYRAAQAWAAIHGRPYVKPDDVKRVSVPVLAHRLSLAAESRVRGRSAEALVEEILGQVPAPVELPEPL